MKKQLSDEQLDQIMRTLMSDAMVPDTQLDSIAESPSIWWGVQRSINQKTSPWPPPTKWWRMLLICAPATAALLLVIVFVFSNRSVNPNYEQAITDSGQVLANPNEPRSNTEAAPMELVKGDEQSVATSASSIPRSIAINVSSSNENSKPEITIAKKVQRPTTAVNKNEDNKEPIKTDFIALSYADNPESGQIVRVKVPSSMMVTLGLVASVEKPSSLVDAEVLVGDDGLTHSIRFIRKGL